MLIPVKKNVKYYFYVFSLYYYCKWAKICYEDVAHSILYYKKRYSGKYNQDQIVGLVVLKYLSLRKRKLKRSTFFSVLDNRIDLKEVSNYLGLNVYSIHQVKRYGYSMQQAIFILYFLGDEKRNNQKVITKERIEEIEKLRNGNNCSNELSFLFCCYYLNIEVLDKIFDYVKYKYQFILYKLALEMNIELKTKKEDLLQEIIIMVWNLIENKKIVMAHSNQIWKFIYKSTIYKVKKRMYQISLEETVRHLEDKCFDDKEFIDTVYIRQDIDILSMI